MNWTIIIGPTNGAVASISAATGKIPHRVARLLVDTHLGVPIATVPLGSLNLHPPREPCLSFCTSKCKPFGRRLSSILSYIVLQ